MKDTGMEDMGMEDTTELALDRALQMTFPASDPIAVHQSEEISDDEDQ